jgi:hypothetical protein
MLDYAANAQSYWPVDRIRSLATERHGGAEKLDAEVGKLLDIGCDLTAEDIEIFWTAVSENLQKGRVRLRFVADELPRELKRIIEFLNGQMPDVDVLGVEIPQYIGDTFKALVPRLFGQTELIRQVKQPTLGQPKTTKEAFLSSLGHEVRDFFRELLDKAESMEGVSVDWGTKNAIIKVLPGFSAKPVSILYLTPPGSNGQREPALEFYLQYADSLGMSEGLKDVLVKAGDFNQKGNHTLQLPVSIGRMQQARNAASSFWGWCSDIVKDP